MVVSTSGYTKLVCETFLYTKAEHCQDFVQDNNNGGVYRN